MIIQFVTIVVAILFMAISCAMGNSLADGLLRFVDINTLLCLLLLSLPILAWSGLWKDYVRAFKLLNKNYSCRLGEMRRTKEAVGFMQKQILCAGVITTIYPLIYILGLLTDNLSELGPSVAAVFIGVLYTSILELLHLPLQMEVKRRIIDYMEEE